MCFKKRNKTKQNNYKKKEKVSSSESRTRDLWRVRATRYVLHHATIANVRCQLYLTFFCLEILLVDAVWNLWRIERYIPMERSVLISSNTFWGTPFLESKKDYRQLVGTLFRNNQMVINSGFPRVNCRKW